jgi:hypothetical protein
MRMKTQCKSVIEIATPYYLGMMTLCILVLEGLTNNLLYLLITDSRFKIGATVGPGACRPDYLGIGTLCVLALEEFIMNNFGL